MGHYTLIQYYPCARKIARHLDTFDYPCHTVLMIISTKQEPTEELINSVLDELDETGADLALTKILTHSLAFMEWTMDGMLHQGPVIVVAGGVQLGMALQRRLDAAAAAAASNNE